MYVVKFIIEQLLTVKYIFLEDSKMLSELFAWKTWKFQGIEKWSGKSSNFVFGVFAIAFTKKIFCDIYNWLVSIVVIIALFFLLCLNCIFLYNFWNVAHLSHFCD